MVCDPAEQEPADRKLGGGLVVARGDPAELLDLAEEPLDEVARPVGLPIKRPWRLLAGPRRNDRGCSRRLDQIKNGIGVIRPRMLQESERNQEVAVDKLDADSCGKLVACLASPFRFIPVSGPPPPSLAAAERGLARGDEHGLHHLVPVDAEMDLRRPRRHRPQTFEAFP